MMKTLLVVVNVILILDRSDGIFDWLFGSEKDANSREAVISRPTFEMDTVDDGFMNLAKELSTLDSCNNLVISHLKKTSCSRLSEEDLGKLAVQLLNCQSEVEGRTTYKCTKDMTIGECTSAMDPTTWNAYQIVSNRARALCYSVRQQQFRMKTEFTVNKLVSTTQGQLKAMKDLQEGQEKLGEISTDTLRKVYDGQQELISQQVSLRDAQQNVHKHIAGNLKDLSREKALIAAGNKELADLTEQIKKKLDMTAQQLMSQKFSQKQNHEDILADLASIQNKAQDVWKKIDNSSKLILNYHHEAVQHYQTSLENLQRVNDTVNYILNTIQELSRGLDQRFGWLGKLIGTTGNRLSLITTCVVHLVYFLLAAISAAFLHIPTASRAVLLLVVPLNAMSEVQQGKSLDFLTLTMFIVGVTIVYYFLYWAYSYLFPRPGETPHVERPCNTCLSPLQVLPTSQSDRNDDSFRNPDLKVLSSILNKLQKSADRLINSSPVNRTRPVPIDLDASAISSNTSHLPDTPESTPPTPMPSVNITTLTDSVLTPTEDSFATAHLYASPNIDTVKRHLLDSLNSSSSRRLSRSRSSTPVRGSPYSLKSSPLNASRRPQCLGTTKSGLPCKNASVENKDYCYRHVGNNTPERYLTLL